MSMSHGIILFFGTVWDIGNKRAQSAFSLFMIFMIVIVVASVVIVVVVGATEYSIVYFSWICFHRLNIVAISTIFN